jgi:hypothetical protein
MLPKNIMAAGAVLAAATLSGCAADRTYVHIGYVSPPIKMQYHTYNPNPWYNYNWGPWGPVFIEPHNPNPHHTYFQGPPMPCRPLAWRRHR